jgi:hypothetical protein
VTIRATDGRSGTSTVFAPRGAAALGIGWPDVDAKYRALLPQAGLPAPRIEASLAVIHGFGNVERVSQLVDLLRV